VFAHAGIDGATLVWRDILCEGPVAAVIAVPADRAAYLSRYLEIDAREYVADWHAAHVSLMRAADHDEIVLWFEQDLFCAVNLWYLLDRLAHISIPIALVYPSLDDVRGLGAVEPHRLRELFAERTALSVAAIARGQQAWRAYASATPAAPHAEVHADTGALPFVAAALQRHLARIPAFTTGLNEIEEAALDALQAGSLAFSRLFGAVSGRDPVRRHGMGDLQFAALVRSLASGATPLADIDGGALAACGNWRVGITAAGLAAARGQTRWQPPSRWIGGLHLRGGHAGWRRDGERLLIVGG
jgi:hypothetical protein